MATIDVSELMDDPDFADQVSIIRRNASVGSNGRQTITEVRTDRVNAVVQPASGDTVTKLPEGARIDGAMSIWTRFQLRGVAADVLADEVEWQSRRYVVSVLNDFRNYGTGYSNATLTLKTIPG